MSMTLLAVLQVLSFVLLGYSSYRLGEIKILKGIVRFAKSNLDKDRVEVEKIEILCKELNSKENITDEERIMGFEYSKKLESIVSRTKLLSDLLDFIHVNK